MYPDKMASESIRECKFKLEKQCKLTVTWSGNCTVDGDVVQRSLSGEWFAGGGGDLASLE